MRIRKCSYSEVEVVVDPPVFLMCDECGVLVGDDDKHNEFHSDLENSLDVIRRTANSAFAGSYPQGYGR